MKMLACNANEMKWSQVRALDFPLGQYAITGSGPLGIRNLREINDVDIIVTPDLWAKLAAEHVVIDTCDIKKIVLDTLNVEIFTEGSFLGFARDKDAPSVTGRIARADVIDGLPFESLSDVLYYKRKMGRPKDLVDVQLIENWLKTRKI